jgi:hypothetical protein
MSRRETDREDLLREATALVERVEIRVQGEDEPVVAGFRRDGSLSVFFGPDPVYQFNSAGELRRAYVGGLLYKTEQGRLVELRRKRSEQEVALVRRELDAAEAAALLTTARSRLAQLGEALSRGDFQLVGQVPVDADVTGRIGNWLSTLSPVLQIAKAPNAR